ncbi:unnamed protein product [Brassicogethes aeneus]|uniref:Protein CUSTOS n=1 Tax=Brassicogethes aeneus TaxID=1431903 RepID=A0A9P0AZB5_BRAAE|nr:unnamed protein product [Brassicogethes aeneus]
MSDSSSEDENLELLREAADSQFICDDMFNDKSKNGDVAVKIDVNNLPPSLRKSKDEDEQFNLFHVTPEFRNYVAKHLSKLLEENLKKKLISVSDKCEKKKKRKGGVKLLRNSEVFIKISKNKDEAIERKRKDILPCVSQDVSENELKIIAVSGDDILERKGVESWCKRTKKKPFKYKKVKNGTFQYVPDTNI